MSFFFFGGMTLPDPGLEIANVRLTGLGTRHRRGATPGRFRITHRATGGTIAWWLCSNARRSCLAGSARKWLHRRAHKLPDSDLRDLVEVQLHRGLPAEDGHQHLERLPVGV